MLAETDLRSLELLAGAYGRVCEAERLLAKEGLIVQGSMGQPVRHPAVDILNASSQLYRSLAARFGLTPSDRGALDVPPSNSYREDDHLGELIERARSGRAGNVIPGPGMARK